MNRRRPPAAWAIGALVRGPVLALGLALGLACPGRALGIPATPVMTVYRFNGGLEVPVYDRDDFARRGTAARPVGSLAQGTSVVPCLVIRGGRPLTDASGTPYVGFEVVVDSREATPASAERFEAVRAGREQRVVRNHHCGDGVRRVVDVRLLYDMSKPPRFDPPRTTFSGPTPAAGSELDAIVRAFHDSGACRAAQRRLLGRRAALAAAWSSFARDSARRWPKTSLDRARQLDYVMRTALFEGHLERGCSAYGACERNVIALSIRNRARACQRGQGCRFAGDVEGVASAVTQYNIWDEYLTQISALTSCFLRPDLARRERYDRLQAMYAQSRADIERILFGDAGGLPSIFGGTDPASVRDLRHYYHPPAMGKCFPGHPRIEYMSGAIARNGTDFALLANTRIDVGRKRGRDYEFRAVAIEEGGDRDVVRTIDTFPGFLVDGRKVTLRRASDCRPYGAPPGCRFERVLRHRRTPSWLSSGRPAALSCRVASRGESCRDEPRAEPVTVGGVCDVDMQPVAGVP